MLVAPLEVRELCQVHRWCYEIVMARWSDLEDIAPELISRARGFMDAHVHKTIATLRRDGSPRVSGTECLFMDGNLWFGSMWEAMKAHDLRRDPSSLCTVAPTILLSGKAMRRSRAWRRRSPTVM